MNYHALLREQVEEDGRLQALRDPDALPPGRKPVQRRHTRRNRL